MELLGIDCTIVGAAIGSAKLSNSTPNETQLEVVELKVDFVLDLMKAKAANFNIEKS